MRWLRKGWGPWRHAAMLNEWQSQHATSILDAPYQGKEPSPWSNIFILSSFGQQCSIIASQLATATTSQGLIQYGCQQQTQPLSSRKCLVSKFHKPSPSRVYPITGKLQSKLKVLPHQIAWLNSFQDRCSFLTLWFSALAAAAVWNVRPLFIWTKVKRRSLSLEPSSSTSWIPLLVKLQ